MSNPESKDEITTLVIRSAHELATRSSLVVRGLKDISSSFQENLPQSAEDRALELFNESKFAEAIFICTTGLDANPKDECLWLIKGMCLSKQEKYDELLQCLIPLLENDANNANYCALAAQVLRRLNRTEEELEYWQRVIEIDPDYEGAWRAVGDCLLEVGRSQDAVQAFDFELKLNPSDAYCQSRREIALAAKWKNENQVLSRLESTELKVSLMVAVEHWWTEPSPKTQLATVTPRSRSFCFVCSIENISDQEQLLGKELTVVRYSPKTGERSWVADALILDSTTIPEKIGVDSEWSRVIIELTWLCSPEMSEADCVQEFLSDEYETLGYDDRFGTVLLFA
jgi:tetratricopeptide (TPR) repeat protein